MLKNVRRANIYKKNKKQTSKHPFIFYNTIHVNVYHILNSFFFSTEVYPMTLHKDKKYIIWILL